MRSTTSSPGRRAPSSTTWRRSRAISSSSASPARWGRRWRAWPSARRRRAASSASPASATARCATGSASTASRRSPATCSIAPRSPRCPTRRTSIFAAGHKFGASGAPALTWAMNTHVPALVAERYRAARIVAFSTGNVYGLVPVGGAGASEATRADAGRRVRAVVPRPRAHVRVLLGEARHAGPHRPPQLRDRHALRRRLRCRREGLARRAGRRDDGPRQRHLAGRRQRAGAALPRAVARRRRRRSTSPAPRRSRSAGSRTARRAPGHRRRRSSARRRRRRCSPTRPRRRRCSALRSFRSVACSTGSPTG